MSYNKKLEQIVEENLKNWPKTAIRGRVHPSDEVTTIRKRKRRKRLSAKQAAKRAMK